MNGAVDAAIRERHRPRPFGLDLRCTECNRPWPCPVEKARTGDLRVVPPVRLIDAGGT